MPDFDPATRPNTLPWPPIIYACAIAAAVVGQSLMPLRLPAMLGAIGALFGLLCLIAGILFDVWAIRTLGAARTTFRPDRASAALVTGGPFAFSRNPIYLGNTLALAGLALVFEVPWFLVMAVPAAIAVDRFAIMREEAHLAARFPEAWRAYAARVRRWV